jgi:hypothetical protein
MILKDFFIHLLNEMLDEDVHVHDDVIQNMNIQSSFHDLIKYQLLLDHR